MFAADKVGDTMTVARSPLAPTDPFSGISGQTPQFKRATSCWTVDRRIPE